MTMTGANSGANHVDPDDVRHLMRPVLPLPTPVYGEEIELHEGAEGSSGSTTYVNEELYSKDHLKPILPRQSDEDKGGIEKRLTKDLESNAEASEDAESKEKSAVRYASPKDGKDDDAGASAATAVGEEQGIQASQMHVNMNMQLLEGKEKSDAHDPPPKQPGFDDLLFDLLFAACLSVYSNNADLSSASKIAVFIGFFALLWWSWWSQTLFDVRYRGRDRMDFLTQTVQRVVRCALLGVWVAYSTVASEFARSSYTNFTTIYICSRGLLGVDYLTIILRSLVRPLEMRDAHVPGAVQRRNRSRFSPLISHLIMIAGLVISIVLWVGSWYVRGGQTLPPAVIGLWVAGIAVELITEVIVEWNASLRSLGATPIVERMALFSLIVFGNGFERVGNALNQISPGSRDWTRGGIPIGGWSSITVVNAGASVAIVLLLFNSYFTRAVLEFNAHPARLLGWSYVHLPLQVAAAVLMVGLGNMVGFVNTLTALARFVESPELYLPNTTDWRAYIENDFLATINTTDSFPSIPSISNFYDQRALAVFVSTLSLQGAEIPNVDVAMALANSTAPFANVSLSAAIQTNLQGYVRLITNVQDPNGAEKFFDHNVYSFYYVYLCPAIFLFADVVLKVLQHYKGGRLRSLEKLLLWSFGVRVFFACLLIAVQGIYYATLDKSDSSDTLLTGLVLLAAILLLESLAQIACTHCRSIASLWRQLSSFCRGARRR